MSHNIGTRGGAVTTITPGASPYVFKNATGGQTFVIVTGGTVSAIEWSRDGAAWTLTGLIAGGVPLNIGDSVRVTYAVAPTMTLVPM